jgi:hypothetical protein
VPYGHASDPYAHGDKGEKKKEDKGHSTGKLVAVGVGGAAAGAFIGHEMSKSNLCTMLARYVYSQLPAEDSSDDEKHTTTYVPAAPPAAAPVYAQEPTYAEPPPVPTKDADGDSISSSDRESLEEKREELIEAQEEYEEEVEEAYDD